MNKLNERLTLIANLSVVLGIVFLAVELQQNTQAIQAQTRDSLTEKQNGVRSFDRRDSGTGRSLVAEHSGELDGGDRFAW